MNHNEINCWSDASYSQHKSVSIVAYKINFDSIKTIKFDNIKNTQAEIFGIEFCINLIIKNYPQVQIINIYTDCQYAFKQNYSIYKNQLNVQIQINLIKVKGHQKMKNMNWSDLIFKKVDKFARKTLRNL